MTVGVSGGQSKRQIAFAGGSFFSESVGAYASFDLYLLLNLTEYDN